jgi:K+-sensing histidine kinase KdpD
LHLFRQYGVRYALEKPIGPRGGTLMWFVKAAMPVTVSAVIVSALTAALWYAKQSANAVHHPVFFYLLPLAMVAILFGSRQGLLCAVAAAACSAFFLYDPAYSFAIANSREWGDLVCFAVLASITVKCADELTRPIAKIPTAKSRYGSP